jgi:hypothetical protein
MKTLKLIVLAVALSGLGVAAKETKEAKDPGSKHKGTKECNACCETAAKCDACCHDKGKGVECKACCFK